MQTHQSIVNRYAPFNLYHCTTGTTSRLSWDFSFVYQMSRISYLGWKSILLTYQKFQGCFHIIMSQAERDVSTSFYDANLLERRELTFQWLFLFSFKMKNSAIGELTWFPDTNSRPTFAPLSVYNSRFKGRNSSLFLCLFRSPQHRRWKKSNLKKITIML